MKNKSENHYNICFLFFNKYIPIIFPFIILFLKVSAIEIVFVLGIVSQIGLLFAPLIDQTNLLGLITFYALLIAAVIYLFFALIDFAYHSHIVVRWVIFLLILFYVSFEIISLIHNAPLLLSLICFLIFFFISVMLSLTFVSIVIQYDERMFKNFFLTQKFHIKRKWKLRKKAFQFYFKKYLENLFIKTLWLALALTSFFSGQEYVRYLQFSQPQFEAIIETTNKQFNKTKITLILPAKKGWIVTNRQDLQFHYLSSQKIISLTPRQRITKEDWEIREKRFTSHERALNKILLRINEWKELVMNIYFIPKDKTAK